MSHRQIQRTPVLQVYSKFLNSCQSGSTCPWCVGTCRWRVDGDRRLSYWLHLLGAIRKIERRLNCVNIRSAFSQWEKRRNPSSTWYYVSTRKQQNTLQLPTIKKFAVNRRLLEFTACRTLFFLLFSSRTFAFDFTNFRTTSFWRGKNVKKTTSVSLFWKAETTHFQPIRIYRKQYKYQKDHCRGTKNYLFKFELTVKTDGIRWCHHFEDNENMKLSISW